MEGSGKEKVPKRRVFFALNLPGAREVYLVGDFNDWDKRSLPMKKDSRGIWRKGMTLTRGTYEYRYLVDGEWYTDERKEKNQNPFGTFNNVIRV